MPTAVANRSTANPIPGGAGVRIPKILEITSADIRKMEDAFASPMCDIASRNAAALALSRALNGAEVRICPHESTAARLAAEIDSMEFPLPRALNLWLRDAIHGLSVKPRRFSLR